MADANSDQERRRRVPGAVSGLVGDFSTPPPVIRDAQSHDAELPDRAADVPPTWIDPQLLTDEIEAPPAHPPVRRAPPSPPEPLGPAFSGGGDGDLAPTRSETRRRIPRPATEVTAEPLPRSPHRAAAEMEPPAIASPPVAPPAAAPDDSAAIAEQPETPRRRRRVPLPEQALESAAPADAEADGISSASVRQMPPEPPLDDIFSDPREVFADDTPPSPPTGAGLAAPAEDDAPEREAGWDEPGAAEEVEAEPVPVMPRALQPAPAAAPAALAESEAPAGRQRLSDYLASLDDDGDEDEFEDFPLPPSLSVDEPARASAQRDEPEAAMGTGPRVTEEDAPGPAPARRRGRRRRKAAGEVREEDLGISWDDDESPGEASPEEGEAPAWTPSIAVSAARGVFAGHSALSLLSPNLTQEHDELNDALAAFGGLEPGMRGFIRITFRAYPEFKGDSARFIGAVKTGTDPDPRRSLPQLGFGLISWGIQSLMHLATGAAQRGAPAPRPPWKGPEIREISFKDMTDDMRQSIKDAEAKSRDVAFYETMLTVGVAGSPKDAAELERVRMGIEAGFEVYATPHQRLVWEEWPGLDATIGYMPSRQERRLVLSAGELGELARVPDALTRPQGVVVRRARVKPLPPTNPLIVNDPLEPEAGVIPLGIISRGTDDEKVIGMRNAELDQHAFIVGRTGTGKSVLLHWLIHGSIKAGYPVVVVDPHGSLGDDILRNIIRFAPERADDVVLLDFGNKLWPVALNPLDISDAEQVEPTVASVKEMLARQMSLGGDSAPRAVAYVTQALSVLAEANLYLHDPETKCTLLQVPRFFQDTEFRQLLMNFCSNPSVREAFDPEMGLFEQMSTKQQLEIAAPINRAFQPLMNSRSFANSFAAGENRLDFAKLISANKIIILKIPRFGGQTELGSFVGALAIPYLLQSMDDWGRKPDPKTGELSGRGLRLFIDEAPTVCGPNSSAVSVLAEARKWDLGLVAAAQFPKQLDRAVEEAFYANTASKISLALDPGGVGGMARSLAGDSKLIGTDDIVALPNYAAYASVLLSDAGGGKFTSGAFSMGTLPPLNVWAAQKEGTKPRSRLTDAEDELLERIAARSREIVCNPRDEVEEKRGRIVEDIRSALTQVLQDRADSLPGARARNDEAGGFTAMDLDADDEGGGSIDWLDLD